jgi:hypothetical protein
MRQKKRYVLLKEIPKKLPEGSKFLFQNSSGYIVKTDLEGAKILRKDALLISGSVWKLKDPSTSPLSKKHKGKCGMK